MKIKKLTIIVITICIVSIAILACVHQNSSIIPTTTVSTISPTSTTTLGILGTSSTTVTTNAKSGELNQGLINNLQDKPSNYMVNVMLVVDLKSDIASSLPLYIQESGFSISEIGDTTNMRFIYTKLSKEFIFELVNEYNVYIEQVVPTVT
jgi:hypothetical protein